MSFTESEFKRRQKQMWDYNGKKPSDREVAESLKRQKENQEKANKEFRARQNKPVESSSSSSSSSEVELSFDSEHTSDEDLPPVFKQQLRPRLQKEDVGPSGAEAARRLDEFETTRGQVIAEKGSGMRTGPDVRPDGWTRYVPEESSVWYKVPHKLHVERNAFYDAHTAEEVLKDPKLMAQQRQLRGRLQAESTVPYADYLENKKKKEKKKRKKAEADEAPPPPPRSPSPPPPPPATGRKKAPATDKTKQQHLRNEAARRGEGYAYPSRANRYLRTPAQVTDIRNREAAEQYEVSWRRKVERNHKLRGI
jgi:hypothetical protein